MMMMKSPDNIQITSLDELHIQMRHVKQRIKEREASLANRWKQIPEETVKASVSAILPAFIGNKVASGVWTVLKGAYDMVQGKSPVAENAEGWKGTIASGAKQLGVFTALKLIFSLWKGRK
jgi:hypothetical protein